MDIKKYLEPEKKKKKLASDDCKKAADPSVLICWNCNGLSARLNPDPKKGKLPDTQKIVAFCQKEMPDVMFFSEVRLTAAGPMGCKRGDGRPRQRDSMNRNDWAAASDADKVLDFLRTPPLNTYSSYFSLSDWKYSGTCMLVNRNTVELPVVRYNLDLYDVDSAASNSHYEDGRVILAEFGSFFVLHSYSPNNGGKAPSFERRCAWDLKIRNFVKKIQERGKPLIWMGDLNIAPEDADLSNPELFTSISPASRIRKRIKLDPILMDPENIGLPGCTPAERRRFHDIVKTGQLTDAFVMCHPEERTTTGAYFTWRQGGFGQKHQAMRLDHAIVSSSLTSRLKGCDILGQGFDMEGFLGSDHCPLRLCLQMD